MYAAAIVNTSRLVLFSLYIFLRIEIANIIVIIIISELDSFEKFHAMALNYCQWTMIIFCARYLLIHESNLYHYNTFVLQGLNLFPIMNFKSKIFVNDNNIMQEKIGRK